VTESLAGIKVVDLSRVLGGPFCSQILGDHGAEIVKVEPPQGDETREWGPPFKDGLSSYYVGVNRNKESIALDLSQARGREVLFRLLDRADVLLENFKTGTMERWGIGYETLKERFPRLVHCRVSGFGADGPLGGLPGYDAVAQALSGLISINGKPESGPVRMGVPIVDLCTGMYAAMGILMALLERERSGRGQFLEVALYDTGISILHPHAPNYFMSEKDPELTGDSHPNLAPYSQYPTATRNIFMGAGNNRQFRRMCEELGKPELADDPRFSVNTERNKNRALLNAELGHLLARRDAEEVSRKLLAKGVPAGAVLHIPEVVSHPHTRHRGMVVEKDGYRGTGIPIKFSRTAGSVRSTPPQFGASTRAILRKAGYSEDEIEALFREGIAVAERRPVKE